MKREYVLFDNDNYATESIFNEAKEALIDLGNANPSDEQVWDEVDYWENEAWDEFKAEMESILCGEKFLAVGTCGTWRGNFEGGFIFETFGDMMDYFKDCSYFKFWDENGHLFVDATHHDGTHSVEIKQLTKRGVTYYDNWNYGTDARTEREVHKKLFGDSHYSKLINARNKMLVNSI